MDPDQLQGLVMFLGLAENLIGSDVIPGLKKFFGAHYDLTPEQLADLDDGFIKLSAAREQLKKRRADIAAAGGQ